MPSMKSQLRCPHCFCNLEVSAVITQLSLQYIKDNNKKKQLEQKPQPDEEGGDIKQLPAPKHSQE